MPDARGLRLPQAIDEGIRRHGQETYPHECCGALLGRRRRGDVENIEGVESVEIVDLVPLPNTTEEGPRRRFLVRPSDYRVAEQQAAERGAELVGFYHSHPDHPARPSQYDLDHAWPTFAYIIISVVDGDAGVPGPSAPTARAALENGAKAGEMTVWYLKDDRSTFEEGTLHHGENPHPDTAAAVHR